MRLLFIGLYQKRFKIPKTGTILTKVYVGLHKTEVATYIINIPRPKMDVKNYTLNRNRAFEKIQKYPKKMTDDPKQIRDQINENVIMHVFSDCPKQCV